MAADPLAPLVERPEVRLAVEQAREAVDRLLGHRVLRRRSAEVTAESSLRGARASGDLEGATLPLEQLRAQLVAGRPVGGLPEPGRTLLGNAVNLHAELGGVVGAWERAPRQALARLHVLAAAGVAPAEELGRPRSGSLPGFPDPAEVVERLDALSDLLTGGSSAPAVVLAAVVHGELLALRPFAVGTGLVARAASRLVLISLGLDPKVVSAPEVGHAELREEYAAAAAAYSRGGVPAVTGWVAHCARAVALGAREGVAVCEAIQRGAASAG